MEDKANTSIKIEDEIRQSYMDYAMSVIVGRALPEVRDGLKPVQRRVLYAMHEEGLVSTKKTSKCAGVVGEVLKKFHPHGDSAVYDALVRLAQNWVLRYPLVDGQGNFGSIDGDPAAAYRYTECRMTALAERLLQDIEKETTDFVPNFDDSTKEPFVLPAIWPNLLVNGADGIAVGMATHIPPHNLTEVCAGAIAVLHDPAISVEQLMRHIPGPDFPTGGIILGRQPIISAYATGRGIIQVRAKTHIEQIKSKSREGEAIVVTEIPYQVNKARLIEKIADLVNEKVIEGISKFRDESDRHGMRIVIELKRDATTDIVLNQLYKHTQLQSSFGVINLAIVDGQPVVCTLKDLISHFLNHRRDVVVRRTSFELRKAEERMHLLEGFKIALAELDEVIQLIKKSKTPAEAKAGLMSRYALSEIQAQAILDLRLQKLTGMERLAIDKEHDELAQEIVRLRSILADPKKVDGIITAELTEVKEKYGDPRRTEIIDDGGAIIIEDLIEDEQMVISVSHKGYIKRTPLAEYREQKRGGKGVYGAAATDDDFISHLFVASARTELMIFTTSAKVYRKKVYEIPEAGRTARGRNIINLLNLADDEQLASVQPVKNFEEGKYLLLATELGNIKRSELTEYASVRQNGLIACKLREGDRLIGVTISSGSDDIILTSNQGRTARFAETGVSVQGRVSQGVRGIRLRAGGVACGMALIAKGEGVEGDSERIGEDGTLLTICAQGYGKRTKFENYPTKNRGSQGVMDIKTTDRNGEVVGVMPVNDESQIMIITSSGKIIRMRAGDISVVGRNTLGVRLVSLDDGERVVAIAKVVDNGLDNGDSEEGEE